MEALFIGISLHNATCFVLSNIKSSFRILSNGHIKTKIDLTKKIEKPMFRNDLVHMCIYKQPSY